MFFKRKKNSGSSERRDYPRVELFQQSYCNFQKGSNSSNAYNCRIKNISIGGLSFDVNYNGFTEFEAEHVNVLFRIGTKIWKESLKITYRKKELSNLRCGCEFVDQNLGRHEEIVKFIAVKSD